MASEKVQINALIPEKLNAQIRVVAEVDEDRISVAVEKALSAYVESRKLDPEWQERHEEWVRRQRKLIRAL